MRNSRNIQQARAFAATVCCLAIAPVVAATNNHALAIRPAYCAGTWYPGQASALTKQIDDLVGRADAPPIGGQPIALIAPHAGYRFSAPVAAAGYACLRGQSYKRVIVLAFSHRYAGSYHGVDVPRDLGAYETPLGQVPVDRRVVGQLLSEPGFVSHAGMDRNEHALELQLPFLQRVVGPFHLVPMLVGQMSPQDCASAAKAIIRCLDADTLLVASTDFTHFGPNFGYEPFSEDVPNKIRELAEQAAEPLLKCDLDGFLDHLAKTGDTICGRGPVTLLLRILSMQGGAKGTLAAFDTSGRLTGDWTNSVTYQSIVFTRRPTQLDAMERRELLRLARQTITAYLDGRKIPEVDANTLPPSLCADGACFVTLENHGALRGCIGNMVASGPLYQAVIRNAVSACQDSRFVYHPVTADELDKLDIEISYLTPMQRISHTDEIIVGQHGLLMTAGQRRGVLLPQVAYERGWTRQEFLARTCQKAGLPPDAWKWPNAEISSFEAEVFGETEPPATQPAERP